MFHRLLEQMCGSISASLFQQMPMAKKETDKHKKSATTAEQHSASIWEYNKHEKPLSTSPLKKTPQQPLYRDKYYIVFGIVTTIFSLVLNTEVLKSPNFAFLEIILATFSPKRPTGT